MSNIVFHISFVLKLPCSGFKGPLVACGVKMATVMVVAVCFLSSITASSITLVLTWITTSHGAQSLLILTGMESGESV